MATKYEYYDTGDDGYSAVRLPYWNGQTFTPSVAHRITSVKLLIYRINTPGTFTVGIRATSEGLPTGGDLCSGSIDGDGLSTSHAWVEITLGAGAILSVDTMYAIVVDARDSESDSDRVGWRRDGSSPTYAGGTFVNSENNGVDWTLNADVDHMFEDWGEPLAKPPTFSLDPKPRIRARFYPSLKLGG